MLEAALAAVHGACLICRHVQRKIADVRAVLKDDKSPVTVADFASQAAVALLLERALGRIELVAEEDAGEVRERMKQGDRSLIDAIVEAVRVVRPDADAQLVLRAIDLGGADPLAARDRGFWTLDPIDGTKGFLRGEQYAVSLGWIVGNAPKLGVLGCPNLSIDRARSVSDPDPRGTIYYAEQGKGLFELPADDPRAQPRNVRRTPLAAGAKVRLCESVESGHTKHDASAEVITRIGGASESLRLDSQAKYAVVARGQADVYLRMPNKKGYVERIWDHAAGSLLALEGGCLVTDVHGKPLDFAHGRGLEKNLGVVVAPPEVHAKLISVIGELGLDRV
jgi:3'(2'), 5'-bisphosphate nucleotidase